MSRTEICFLVVFFFKYPTLCSVDLILIWNFISVPNPICQQLLIPQLQLIINEIINLKHSQKAAIGLAFFSWVSVFSEGICIPQL